MTSFLFWFGCRAPNDFIPLTVNKIGIDVDITGQHPDMKPMLETLSNRSNSMPFIHVEISDALEIEQMLSYLPGINRRQDSSIRFGAMPAFIVVLESDSHAPMTIYLTSAGDFWWHANRDYGAGAKQCNTGLYEFIMRRTGVEITDNPWDHERVGEVDESMLRRMETEKNRRAAPTAPHSRSR